MSLPAATLLLILLLAPGSLFAGEMRPDESMVAEPEFLSSQFIRRAFHPEVTKVLGTIVLRNGELPHRSLCGEVFEIERDSARIG